MARDTANEHRHAEHRAGRGHLAAQGRRRTSRGVPRYADDTDVFVLSGAEDRTLVLRTAPLLAAAVAVAAVAMPAQALFLRPVSHSPAAVVALNPGDPGPGGPDPQ